MAPPCLVGSIIIYYLVCLRGPNFFKYIYIHIWHIPRRFPKWRISHWENKPNHLQQIQVIGSILFENLQQRGFAPDKWRQSTLESPMSMSNPNPFIRNPVKSCEIQSCQSCSIPTKKIQAPKFIKHHETNMKPISFPPFLPAFCPSHRSEAVAGVERLNGLQIAWDRRVLGGRTPIFATAHRKNDLEATVNGLV